VNDGQHRLQITTWKEQLVEAAAGLFGSGGTLKAPQTDKSVDRLFLGSP
jgi:hypothetical protein